MKHLMSKILGVVLVMALPLMITSCDEFINAINDNPVSPSLTIKTEKLTVKVGETVKCKFTVSTMAVMKFQSADTSIATVDDQGNVTGVKEGKTTITLTVTTYDANKTWKNNVFSDATATIDVEVIAADAEEDEDEETKAATVTTAPVATTGDILAGSATTLVVAGVADGGTMMYLVTAANEAKPTSTDGFSADIPSASNRAEDTYSVWYYAKGDAQHSDSEIAATAVEVTIKPSLATPLTLKAITAGTIVVNNPQAGMQYSLNGGAKQAVTTDAITVAIGDKVQFYGNGTSITAYYSNDYTDNDTKITGGTAEVKVYGNIMSLVDETGFATNTTLPAEQTFRSLFENNAKLKDASGLLLPAETLTNYCYNSMFQDCTALTAAPAELPATSLANSCYRNMFYGCTSLTTAPALSATELAEFCYASMFFNCSSLTTAPALPVTDLKERCYNSMFRGCSSLTTAPKLPATTLAQECYFSMFNGCTSLTTAYVKAAYETTNHECDNMFTGCTATGATLHTTDTNEPSWDAVMPSTWNNWTADNNWTD